MFVYIIGNVDQNIFQLGIAGDPFQKLAILQEGNPYKLSVLCKICVSSKNEASLVEQLARKELEKYEGMGGWYANAPEVLSTQLASDHYLRLIASRVDVKVSDRARKPASKKRTNLQRLTASAKRKGLAFEKVLEKVEKAYDEGIEVDSLF